jgi:hypothetical protein
MAATKTGARKASEPELMGAAEASSCLGVLQQNLRTISGLPEAYDKIRATTLWRAEEIRSLAEKRGRRNARP